MERKRSSELLALSKVHLAATVGVLTRHRPKGIHAVWLEILPGVSCQSCMDHGEVETSRHYLLHCLVFSRLRLKHLGNHTFGWSVDLAETYIRSLNKFIILGSKRFIDL